MQELWYRIWTRPRYGAAFLALLVFLFLFVWRTFAPESFGDKIGGFIKDMQILFQYLLYYALYIAVLIFGIRLLFGWRPFKKTGGNKSHS